jgi:hypothetical protein
VAPTQRVSPHSTIPILPSEPLLLDDRVLVALLVGEGLPIARQGKLFTTMYFYFRACRAVVAGVGGRLSGPFQRLDQDRQAAALEQMLTLPDDVGLPDSRQLVPAMVALHRRHPHLSLLNTEAAAAALVLRAKMVLTPPSAAGQLAEVLSIRGISYQTVLLS